MSYKKSKIAILIMSFICFITAGIITLEKIEILTNPQHVPSCSINPLLSCGPIMASWQASLFVIPNPIIGLVGFALLCFIMGLSLSIKLPKWVWLMTFVGVSLATIFIIWLISQSLFVIGALCIYCMLVWSLMIPTFISISYLIVLALIFVAFKDYWLLQFGL
jgi:uncharacterized membrane protein